MLAASDRVIRTGRPLLWVAGFVLVALVAGSVAYRSFDREVITPAATAKSQTTTDPRADEANRLLLRLTSVLSHGTRREALTLAAPGERSARRELGMIFDNVRHLGVTGISMRFIDDRPGELNDVDRRTLGDRAWVGDVALGWRIGGPDKRVGNMEVSLAFVDAPGRVSFGSADGDYGKPAPLWLIDDLAVARSSRALVAVTDPAQLPRYDGLANQAVRDVRKVLPRWRGRLVVEVPSSQDELDRVLDAQPNTYNSIAAVTATVDGSESPSSPVHIVVNPRVFGGLGPEGSQIVMSHEATHVAMNAATSTMPLWLLEGFADYVALDHAGLPVSVTASQILAEVRRKGPPPTLPGAHEFDPSNKLLGTEYEAAWLACRLLGHKYGEQRLIAFYKSVDAGSSTEAAFKNLGTTEAAFTRQWRDYLRQLAG